jgi:hypothetical protein
MAYLFWYNSTYIIKYEVFDFETIERNNKLLPLCISFTDENQVYFFWIKDNSQFEACTIIFNYFKSNVIYYAHNLLFDFLLIINVVISHNIKYSWVFINYKLYEVKLFYLDKIIVLRCSHKLIPFPLNQFFPTFSKKKKTIFSIWNSFKLGFKNIMLKF